jgi:hypothetical protein
MEILPQALRRSLIWDQGPEMRDWKQVHDADIEVFFCDPHSPWQRATNENTNGLLRQYSPKASTSPPSPTPTWTPSPTNSTSARASASASPPRAEQLSEPAVAMTARIRRSACETRPRT